MDLDYEELKATRKLNGVAKDSNIEIIEDFINEMRSFELNKDIVEIVNTLEDILSERKQDKARIQELEEILLKVKDKNITLFITCRNSIPKQKVKDTINENGFEVYTREYGNVEVVSIEALEELLEDK